MTIPNESRATMQALRSGRTLSKFLDEMWDRREAENPRDAKPSKGWPFVHIACKPSNVTAIVKVRS